MTTSQYLTGCHAISRILRARARREYGRRLSVSSAAGKADEYIIGRCLGCGWLCGIQRQTLCPKGPFVCSLCRWQSSVDSKLCSHFSGRCLRRCPSSNKPAVWLGFGSIKRLTPSIAPNPTRVFYRSNVSLGFDMHLNAFRTAEWVCKIRLGFFSGRLDCWLEVGHYIAESGCCQASACVSPWHFPLSRWQKCSG